MRLNRHDRKRMAMKGLMEENPKPATEVADEMLKSIGARVLEMFQGGGRKLEAFDNSYADAIFNRFGHGQNPTGSIVRAGSNEPIMNIVRQDAGGVPGMVAAKYGMLGANLASRYALPAGAAMLGAKGLADLTNGMYDAASEQPIF
jgi:hypothetical protein